MALRRIPWLAGGMLLPVIAVCTVAADWIVRGKVRKAHWMRYLPSLLPSARRGVLAGLSLASTSIPLVLGYTRIAGMPVVTGLHRCRGAARHDQADVAAVRATCRHLRGLGSKLSSPQRSLAGWRCGVEGGE